MGGGKTYALCCAAIRHAYLFPGSRVLLARFLEDELYKNPKHLFFDIVSSKKLRKDFEKPANWDYRERTNICRMKNGSEIQFATLYGTAGLQQALNRWKNVEYSLIGIDQVEELEGHFPLYELLLQRCRYSAAPPTERHLLSVANDEGDNWIRRRFLTYEPPHVKSGDPLAQRRLVRCSSWDNPHLDDGARAQLRALPDDVQRRYVYAPMDAGNVRLIPALTVTSSFDIPGHWPRWCGIDPARSSGVTCAEYVTANPGDVYEGIPPNSLVFYAEYWREGQDAEAHAMGILAGGGRVRMRGTVMDHSAWHETSRSRRYGSITVADFYIRGGLTAAPSTGDEWARVQLYQAASRRGLFAFADCTHLLSQAPEYRIKGQRMATGTVLISAKQKYHAIDAGGYALSLVPTRVSPVDVFEPRPDFVVHTKDPDSVAHWRHFQEGLPGPKDRASAVTRGLDEVEFNREFSDDPEPFRPEEELEW